MAILSPDDLFYGTRGRVGDLVFRRVNGKTVMSRRPRKPDAAKQSDAQKKTRSKFQLATIWAKTILADPEQKARYSELAKQWGLTNARIAAIKDYMKHVEAKEETIRPGVSEEREREVSMREHVRGERTQEGPREVKRASLAQGDEVSKLRRDRLRLASFIEKRHPPATKHYYRLDTMSWQTYYLTDSQLI